MKRLIVTAPWRADRHHRFCVYDEDCAIVLARHKLCLPSKIDKSRRINKLEPKDLGFV